jgi:hypothetical protein
VSAPLSLAPLDVVGEEETVERSSATKSSEGEADRGVEMLLLILVPRVAATEGDGGGSGERVK